MVATLDGHATLEGRSGPISGAADRALFHGLRTAVDAVMAGAGTVRTERYGPIARDPEDRRRRAELGLGERGPWACIVSAGLDLPADLPLLADPDSRVAILTPSSGELAQAATTGTTTGAETGTTTVGAETDTAGAKAGAAGGAETGTAGAAGMGAAGAEIEYVRARRPDGSLDLAAALAELHDRLHVRTLLCEGGPHLNGALLAAGLVDELFLSVSPLLAGGDPDEPADHKPANDPSTSAHAAHAQPAWIVAGPELRPPADLELLGVLEHESHLFLRYCVIANDPD